MNNKVEQTYIFNGKDGKNYFVSTINRTSSTNPPMPYSESLAWEWDEETRKRGDSIIDQDEAGPDSTRGHDALVKRLRG